MCWGEGYDDRAQHGPPQQPARVYAESVGTGTRCSRNSGTMFAGEGDDKKKGK